MTWTRRKFLATTAVAGGGLASAGQPGAARAQGRMITASHSVWTFV
jgi:hypothetical protein